MGKILFLIIIAVLIFWLIKLQKNKLSDANKDSIESAEDMVVCSYCGTHIPKNEALSNANNQYFCSDKHRELHIKS